MWVLYIQLWNIGNAFQEFTSEQAARDAGEAWLRRSANDPNSESNFYLVFPK